MINEKKEIDSGSNLEEIRSQYKKIQSKYDLPDFEVLNENFEIECLFQEETELLVKKIRKQIMEKVSSGLRALEMFLNPQNAPMFIFSVIKSFSSSDKKVIEELYAQFAEFEIEAFGLENIYNEEGEAALVKKICKEWPGISKEFDIIYKSMKINYKKASKKNEKSYLG